MATLKLISLNTSSSFYFEYFTNSSLIDIQTLSHFRIGSCHYPQVALFTIVKLVLPFPTNF